MPTPSVAVAPIAIDSKSLEAVVDLLRPTLRDAVAEGIKGLSLHTLASPQAEVGVELTEQDRQKAKVVKEELRHPERTMDDRLLIDVGTVAHVLSISTGTVYRLAHSGQMPPPVKMEGRMIRWRADEIRAWVDADCPMMENWRWPRPPAIQISGRTSGRR